MKRITFILALLVTISGCYTPSPAETASSASGRFRIDMGKKIDTTTVVESKKIPLSGRNANGVEDALEGTWVLQVINGKTLADTSGLHIANLKRKEVVERSDTVTTAVPAAGGTKIVTEINIVKPATPPDGITPAPGTNYHKPEKPNISFYGSNETFTGFTGCNKISGRYTMSSPNVISFRKAAPSTRMVCIGDYDESLFVNTLHEVNRFKAENGKLQLLTGEKVVMEFARQ